MSLRQKVLSILLGAILLFIGAESAFHHWIVLPGFLRLEERQAEQDLQRVRYAIEREIEYLDTVCRDWASWDDMYGFVESRDPEFVDSNFSPATFVDSKINLVFLYDRQGRQVWGDGRETGEGRHLPFELFDRPLLPKILALPENPPAGQALDPPQTAGILPTEHGPLLLAVRPVLTSENQGPIRGTLVMGRLLDASLVETLVEQTRLAFSIRPLPDAAFISAVSPGETRFDKSNGETLVSIQPYPDLRKEPVFLIRVESPRTFIQTVYSMRKHVVLSQWSAGLVMLVLLSTLLQRIFLGPLCRLTAHARSIRTAGDLSARIHSRRGDEIGQLAREFDGMMVEIDQKTAQLAEANDELQRLSDEDMVTGLANRRKFETCLNQEWRRMYRQQRPLSLILCDVDYFKPFNDTYGHLQGDQCLRRIAQALREKIHRPGELAARFGGEEFAAILVDTDLAGAAAVAEAIREAVLRLKIPHKASAVGEFVTLSAGVASFVPAGNLDPQILVELADQALYRAKQQGRNRVCRQNVETFPGSQHCFREG